MCMNAHVCACTTCLWKSEEGSGSLGSPGMGDCGPLCGCWGPNHIPLQEQQALLTSKPSLQTLMVCSSLYLHYYEINLLPYFERLTKQRFSTPIKIIAWSEAKLSPTLLFCSGAPGTPVWDVH